MLSLLIDILYLWMKFQICFFRNTLMSITIIMTTLFKGIRTFQKFLNSMMEKKSFFMKLLRKKLKINRILRNDMSTKKTLNL